MLGFIGVGIDSISLGTQKILADADIVYVEQFTSPISEGIMQELGTTEIIPTKRWMVEDGKEILENARDKKVVLVSYGDPYIATTHIELRTRAIKEGIQTFSVHAASAITSMVGECGLHHYKVGRIATVMNDAKSAITPYWIIHKNLTEQNHTILLLEYNQDKGFFLDPKDALRLILDIEQGQKRHVIDGSSFVIVASRIGSDTQSITAGKISDIIMQDFGAPPHSIIIPGKMHFTESDALKVLARCLDEPQDNSDHTKKISHQMIAKYVPMVKDAIKEIAPYYKDSEEFTEVLDNAIHYIADAENFLKEGKDEVAILSIGYADGLVDALRIAKGLEPKP